MCKEVTEKEFITLRKKMIDYSTNLIVDKISRGNEASKTQEECIYILRDMGLLFEPLKFCQWLNKFPGDKYYTSCVFDTYVDFCLRSINSEIVDVLEKISILNNLIDTVVRQISQNQYNHMNYGTDLVSGYISPYFIISYITSNECKDFRDEISWACPDLLSLPFLLWEIHYDPNIIGVKDKLRNNVLINSSLSELGFSNFLNDFKSYLVGELNNWKDLKDCLNGLEVSYEKYKDAVLYLYSTYKDVKSSSKSLSREESEVEEVFVYLFDVDFKTLDNYGRSLFDSEGERFKGVEDDKNRRWPLTGLPVIISDEASEYSGTVSKVLESSNKDLSRGGRPFDEIVFESKEEYFSELMEREMEHKTQSNKELAEIDSEKENISISTLDKDVLEGLIDTPPSYLKLDAGVMGSINGVGFTGRKRPFDQFKIKKDREFKILAEKLGEEKDKLWNMEEKK